MVVCFWATTKHYRNFNNSPKYSVDTKNQTTLLIFLCFDCASVSVLPSSFESSNEMPCEWMCVWLLFVFFLSLVCIYRISQRVRCVYPNIGAATMTKYRKNIDTQFYMCQHFAGTHKFSASINGICTKSRHIYGSTTVQKVAIAWLLCVVFLCVVVVIAFDLILVVRLLCRCLLHFDIMTHFAFTHSACFKLTILGVVIWYVMPKYIQSLFFYFFLCFIFHNKMFL